MRSRALSRILLWRKAVSGSGGNHSYGAFGLPDGGHLDSGWRRCGRRIAFAAFKYKGGADRWRYEKAVVFSVGGR